MTSEQVTGYYQPLATEAMNQMPGLISEALLTYAPVPKAARSAKSFAPAFNTVKRFKLPKGSGANHTFSGKAGKFADSAGNRELIESVANSGRSLGKDRFGTEWFVKNLPDGRQVYAYAKDGVIKGADFNNPARPINQIMPK